MCTWEGCGRGFPSSGALTKHRRVHTGERPYSCPQCGNRFAAKETLNRHVRTHTGRRDHKCHICGKEFIQNTQLKAHMFHHNGENAMTCDMCGKMFNRKTRLREHVDFIHLRVSTEMMFRCVHQNLFHSNSRKRCPSVTCATRNSWGRKTWTVTLRLISEIEITIAAFVTRNSSPRLPYGSTCKDQSNQISVAFLSFKFFLLQASPSSWTTSSVQLLQ